MTTKGVLMRPGACAPTCLTFATLLIIIIGNNDVVWKLQTGLPVTTVQC